MITWGLHYWKYFLIVVSSAFIVPEVIAIFTNVSNTLSDYAWYELDVNKAFTFSGESVAWWVSFIAVNIAYISLVIHIWFRGPVP